MFGIGMPEMIVIFVVALIVFGPRRLPDLAKSLGKAVREFRNATSELKSAVNLDSDVKDIRHVLDDVKANVRNTAESYIDKAPAVETVAAAGAERKDQQPAADPPAGSVAEGKTGHDG